MVIYWSTVGLKIKEGDLYAHMSDNDLRGW